LQYGLIVQKRVMSVIKSVFRYYFIDDSSLIASML